MSPAPADPECWSYSKPRLTVTLERAPELSLPGSALRVEDKRLPDRVLIVHGIDGAFHAYANHCSCGGFRVDPVPGEEKIRCCTLGMSTFEYAGASLTKRLDHGLTVYPVERGGDTLTVDLGQPVVAPKAAAD